MKNKILLIIVVLLIFSALGIFGFVVYEKKIKGGGSQKNEMTNTANSNQDQEKYVYVDPNEHAKTQIMDSKEITGNIVQIFDPVNAVDGERVVTVQADVIDNDKIKDVDFSKEKTNLPMKREEFNIKVDNKTAFVKGSLKGLRAGDFAYIKIVENIYSGSETTEFNAAEVTVLNLAS